MKRRDELGDKVWKGLADATRRDILDHLAERPLTTGELVARFEGSLCRTAVMKHLDVLVDANLIVVRRQGRQRWNYINPVPIQRVCDRWVGQHVRQMTSALSRLKDHAEAKNRVKATDRRDAKESGRRRSPSTTASDDNRG